MDYKKTQKELYLPKTIPSIVDVPEMIFIMVDGRGDPNTSVSYQSAVEMLYGLSYSIKMSKMGGGAPEGYFDYTVPPLEGLWWLADGEAMDFSDKESFCWTSMIRQPEFVTPEVFEIAKAVLAGKKPDLELTRVRLERFTEGLCAQVMHIGPYVDEPSTIALLNSYITGNGYRSDLTETRRHHEIYLGDPRKTTPEKLKTVLRHPVVLLR